MTLRYEVEDRSGITRGDGPPQRMIYTLWHSRIFAATPIWARKIGRHRKAAVLTSASHDGAILAAAMGFFGLSAVRGSSSRRAVAALVGMRRALEQGIDVCITPDGPRGPRYSFSPGVIKIAEMTGAAVLPIHLTCERAWRLRTWDKMVIPLPFSRVRVIFDEAIVVPRGMDEEQFASHLRAIQQRMLDGVDDL